MGPSPPPRAEAASRPSAARSRARARTTWSTPLKPTGELAGTVLAGGIGSGSGSTSCGCGAEYGCVTIRATNLARYFRARAARLHLALNCDSYLICACRRRSRATAAAHGLQYRHRASHVRQSSSSPRQRRQRLGRRSTADDQAVSRELDPPPRACDACPGESVACVLPPAPPGLLRQSRRLPTG